MIGYGVITTCRRTSYVGAFEPAGAARLPAAFVSFFFFEPGEGLGVVPTSGIVELLGLRAAQVRR